MSFETLCFSMYSDISIRIMAFSSPNITSARTFESSVFPTPVGPRNMNEPMGRFGSPRPVLPRRMARDTASTASSWPMMRCFKMLSRFASFSLSSSASFFTGIPVQEETISAISSAVTVRSPPSLPFVTEVFSSSSSVSFFSSSRSEAAFS